MAAVAATVLFAALLVGAERFGQLSFGDFARNGLFLALGVVATIALFLTDRRMHRQRALVWLAVLFVGLPLLLLGGALFLGLVLLSSDPNLH